MNNIFVRTDDWEQRDIVRDSIEMQGNGCKIGRSADYSRHTGPWNVCMSTVFV